MSKLFSASINLTKIHKERIFEGKKGKYLNLTIAVNDEKDEYGYHMNIQEERTEEERRSKKPITYLGNGKVFWSDEGDYQPKKKEDKPIDIENDDVIDPENLPF